MAAPTNAARAKKVLANLEPSTHGPSLTSIYAGPTSAIAGKTDASGAARDFAV